MKLKAFIKNNKESLLAFFELCKKHKNKTSYIDYSDFSVKFSIYGSNEELTILNQLLSESEFCVASNLTGITEPQIIEPKIKSPVIVASLGRCGSTWLFNSIRKSLKQESLDKDSLLLRNFSNPLQEGICYKTHKMPPDNECVESSKILFTFGEPTDIIASLKLSFGGLALKTHFENFGVPYDKMPLLEKEDVLELEKMFDLYYGAERKDYDLMCLKYDTMHLYEKEISDFLDVEIKLIRESRRTSLYLDKAEKFGIDIQNIRKTYGSLSDKVMFADDYRIIKAKE